MDEPVISAYVPAEQLTQTSAPLLFECVPVAHDKHVVLDEDPTEEEYLPGTHFSQNVPILSRLYVPAGHCLHSSPGTSVAHPLSHIQNIVLAPDDIELMGHFVHKLLDG